MILTRHGPFLLRRTWAGTHIFWYLKRLHEAVEVRSHGIPDLSRMREGPFGALLELAIRDPQPILQILKPHPPVSAATAALR
jgi:hypothetical protein